MLVACEISVGSKREKRTTSKICAGHFYLALLILNPSIRPPPSVICLPDTRYTGIPFHGGAMRHSLEKLKH